MGPPVTVRLDPMEHVFVHRHVNGIRLLHGDRYVLLHRYGHVFLHRDRYHLLHGKRNLFLHWDRHSLHHGDRHRLRDRYVNWKRLWYSYGDRMWNSYRHWLSNWHTCGRIESPNWAAIRRIFIVPRDTSVIEVSIIWEIKERERESFNDSRYSVRYISTHIWKSKFENCAYNPSMEYNYNNLYRGLDPFEARVTRIKEDKIEIRITESTTTYRHF